MQTDDVTAVTAPGLLGPEQRRRLIAASIHVEAGPITALHPRDRELTAVELADGTRLRAQALLIPAAHVPRDELVERLGVTTTDTGHVAVDGRTDRTRVWAAADLADPSGTVARAIAAGATTATAIVRELTAQRLSS